MSSFSNIISLCWWINPDFFNAEY